MNLLYGEKSRFVLFVGADAHIRPRATARVAPTVKLTILL